MMYGELLVCLFLVWYRDVPRMAWNFQVWTGGTRKWWKEGLLVCVDQDD